MDQRQKDLLPTLRRIEELAQELGRDLPAGFARHRANHIAALAAQVALDAAIRESSARRPGATSDPASSLFDRG